MQGTNIHMRHRITHIMFPSPEPVPYYLINKYLFWVRFPCVYAWCSWHRCLTLKYLKYLFKLCDNFLYYNSNYYNTENDFIARNIFNISKRLCFPLPNARTRDKII